LVHLGRDNFRYL